MAKPIKVWSGSEWVDVAIQSTSSTLNSSQTPPTSPALGDLWFDSDTGKVYVYYDSFWVESAGSSYVPLEEKTMTVAVSDETSNISSGTSRITFRAPYAMTLTSNPRASLSTASSSGTTTVDINANGSSIFSTPITIPASYKTSVGQTPPVLSLTSILDDSEITIDIDGAGTGAKGLKVTLYYRMTQ